MKKNNLTKFTEETFCAVDAGNCPFLKNWFTEKFGVIAETSPSGLDGKNLRVWRWKKLYALYMIVNPKFNRKRFGEVFGVAYGTARNWLNDANINNDMVFFMNEFVNAYITEMNKILALPQGEKKLVDYIENRDAALDSLFREAIFYKNNRLIKLLVDKLAKIAGEHGEPNKKSVKKILSAPVITGTILRFFEIAGSFCGYYDNPEKIKEKFETGKAQTEYNYNILRLFINKGDHKEAIEATEILEHYAKKLLEDIGFLEIELLKLRANNEKK